MIGESPRAMYNSALAAYQAEQFLEAEALCRRMLDAHRNDPNALSLLAQIALHKGDEESAVEHLRTAVRSHPKLAPLRVDLGHLYSDLGRFSSALTQFDKAQKLQPDLVIAAARKAEVYERQGRFTRARRAIEPLLRGDVMPIAVIEVAMRIFVHERDYAAAITLGRRALSQDPPESLPLRNICFELARAYERNGQYEEAIDAAKRGNAMLTPSYDPEDHERFVDAMIDYFTPSRLAALPTPDDLSKLPLFIVGMQRSGSTLVERIISTHPRADGVGEFSILQTMSRELPHTLDAAEAFPHCLDQLTQQHVDQHAARYLDSLRDLVPRADRAVNKDLSNFLRLGLIQALFPKARVLHTRRDPLDTCLSCYLERLLPHEAPFACDQEHLGHYYRQYERLMAHWHKTLDLDILDVHYESLIENQEGRTKEIIDFCGLEWDDACLRFHETKRIDRTLSSHQVRKPIYRTSVGRADPFGSLIDPLRAALTDS